MKANVIFTAELNRYISLSTSHNSNDPIYTLHQHKIYFDILIVTFFKGGWQAEPQQGTRENINTSVLLAFVLKGKDDISILLDQSDICR